MPLEINWSTLGQRQGQSQPLTDSTRRVNPMTRRVPKLKTSPIRDSTRRVTPRLAEFNNSGSTLTQLTESSP